jgi:hypothetical protein
MKRVNLLLIVAFTSLSSLSVFGQGSKSGSSSSGSSDAYSVGTNVITGGIGLGGTLASGYTYGTQSPGFSVSYERGLWNAGPGVISLGGYVGIKDYTYNYGSPGDNYSEKWNYTIIGVRGAWHFTGLDIPNLDLYGGLMLSYDALSFSYTDPYGTYAGPAYGNTTSLTPFAGARYYFSPHVGAYGELGVGVFILNLGVAIKF